MSVRGLFLAFPMLALAACQGDPNASGLDQPFRVRGAVFVDGVLPGLPPDATTDTGARITVIETQNTVLYPGQAAKQIGGRATKGSTTVGLRFADLGTGWYRVVVANPDPAAGGELTWSATLDVVRGLPAGPHPMRIVAFDERGQPGVQRELTLCIAREIPDNLNACDPLIAPPAAVLTLEWDTNVDLDLQLVTPDGKLVDAKHPLTVPTTDGTIGADAVRDPRTGRIDRDANGSCAIDGVRRESIVWQGAPLPGTYLVYANLFAACGQPSVRFRASVHAPETTASGTTLVERAAVNGQLLAIDENGGAKTGLFLTDITFE